MKRCFWFAVVTVLILFTSSGAAQLRFALGPKVGINFASASIEPTVQGLSGRTTILFGTAFELMFAKIIGVQVEPSFANKGAYAENIGVQTQGGVVPANVTLSYKEIQIPILFKAKFLDGPVKPYALVGPNLGIVTSANLNYKPVQANTFQETDQDIKANTSSLDFSLDFGAGAEFQLARNVALTGDVRFSLGLSNLDNVAQQAQGQQQSSTKTRGLQILFGALFAI